MAYANPMVLELKTKFVFFKDWISFAGLPRVYLLGFIGELIITFYGIEERTIVWKVSKINSY